MDTTNKKNLKFAIFGVGGTGGVIGGYLANAGNDVTFLARGAHLAAMQEKGLTIHTNHRGDICLPTVKALNAVEFLYTATRPENGVVRLTMADAKQVSQRSAMRYDKSGDDHYDDLSALMKSIRGSDPDAAVHYLARFLEAGDLPSACRRILCSVAEDVGLAYPQAIPIVKACVDSALQLGLPEARLPLADAVLLLATAPKSNSGCMAIDAAIADVKAGRTGPVPRELQNVHADGTGFERDQGYLYPHNFPNHWVRQQYLPDVIRDRTYYTYGDNKTEQAAKRYWDEIKK